MSRQFGRYGVSYNEHTILHGGSYFYCLSSQYGKVTKELQEIQELVELNGGGYADSYYYNYWYENDGVENSQTYYLTDEQVDAVNAVLTTVEPILPEEDLGMSWNVVLYSEDLKYFEANLALDARNNRYFFSNVNGNDAIYYLVPEEYTAIFDEIFFAKWDALGIDTENWPSRDEQKGEDTL